MSTLKNLCDLKIKQVQRQKNNMENFIFKTVEPSSYKKRNRNSQVLIFFISIGIFVIVTLTSYSWKYGLAISIFFLVVQYFKSSRWDKYFITHIETNNKQFVIKYKEKKIEKTVTGNITDFSFKKGNAFNKTRTVYLAIYYKDTLLLKQFEIGEWTEKIFDEIIHTFYCNVNKRK